MEAIAVAVIMAISNIVATYLTQRAIASIIIEPIVKALPKPTRRKENKPRNKSPRKK